MCSHNVPDFTVEVDKPVCDNKIMVSLNSDIRTSRNVLKYADSTYNV